MREIVGARIGAVITNDRCTIAEAFGRNEVAEWIDRARMRFMAAMDLGIHWEMMANGPTLFCIDDEGNPRAPNDKDKGREP